MARKLSSNSADSGPKGAYDDIIGFALLVAALLLLLAQFTFDANDLGYNTTSPNHLVHNSIGMLGAHGAYAFFLLFGEAAYALPFLLVFFGLSRLFAGIAHLRRHNWWSVGCGFLLLVSLTGVLHLADSSKVSRIGTSAGGLLGAVTFGQTKNYNYGLSMLGPIGAAIVYVALGCVSLLFLTRFELGAWLTRLWDAWRTPQAEAQAEEAALERRARELEKQARRLQEQVD